jgi:hypothetical protein
MQQVKAIDDRREKRSAGRHPVSGLRAGLAALSIAGAGAACLAADSAGGLGSAFRPQGWADAPIDGNGERTEANLAGLRVVVASASRSVASIDGKVVRVGDTVNGMRVTLIDQHGVVLTGEGGATERLTVIPPAVKRARPAKPTRDAHGASQ